MHWNHLNVIFDQKWYKDNRSDFVSFPPHLFWIWCQKHVSRKGACFKQVVCLSPCCITSTFNNTLSVWEPRRGVALVFESEMLPYSCLMLDFSCWTVSIFPVIMHQRFGVTDGSGLQAAVVVGVVWLAEISKAFSEKGRHLDVPPKACINSSASMQPL